MLYVRVNSERAVPALAFLWFCLAVSTSQSESSSSVAAMAGPGSSVTVDQSGMGDFRTVQDAINAVPSNGVSPTVIVIKPGVYNEKIVVNKPSITLSGTSASSTIITWNEAWVSVQATTVSVLAPDFVAKRITFQNTFGTNGPAVAVRVAADRAAFYGCRFLSFQDTLLDESGRHYYRSCYIQGGTDFIFGDGQALFEKCHLHSVSPNGGAFTAQQRSSESENTGFSFVGCKLTGLGVGTAILGRPWGPYSRVVFAFSYMSDAVHPHGWDDWGNPSNQRTTFYGQYQCYGPGSSTIGRAAWSHELSQTEAAPFITKAWIGGQDWLRYEKIVVNKPSVTLSGTSASSTIITWNEAWVSVQATTVSVLAPDFVAKRITFQNTFGTNGPAVAVRVAADRAAFYGCRFLSFQDTLLDESGRHYYRSCYIQGGTDFIFGDGQALFEKCHLHSVSPNGGAFTAQQRSSESENTGFSFVGCKLTGLGVGTAILGRPWGPYSRVVFSFSYMSDAVHPRGWDDWGNPSNQRTTFYGQYQCYGPGSSTTGRVAWSHELSQAEAAPFITKAWIGGQDWLR